MHFTPAFLFCVSLSTIVASFLPSHEYILPLAQNTEDYGFRIPSIHESAVQARRILHLETIGTLSTVFPSDGSISPTENRPPGLAGSPIGLMDYFGDCEPDTGNPTILAIGIATSFKNVAAGSNITLSLRWHPPNMRKYSAANMPRFSLVGHLEEMEEAVVKNKGVTNCFVDYHPDAAAWLPGNSIHESRWTRLIVEEIYWIGGFGDRAYIGWISSEEWRNVTKKEIQSVELPGERNGRFW